MTGRKKSFAKRPKRKFHKVNSHTKVVGGRKVKIRAHLKSMPKLMKKTVIKKKSSPKMSKVKKTAKPVTRKAAARKVRKRAARKAMKK